MEDVLKNEGRSKGGRPSIYSDALAEKIVELIEEGYSERQIEAMDGMPSRRTMLRWKIEHPEFCRLSARAREVSADIFNDRRMEVAEWLSQIAHAACEKNKDIPDGVVKAAKVLIQQYAREAALRDDRRFGDRRRVTVEPVAHGEGMAAFYAKLREDLNRLDDADRQ